MGFPGGLARKKPPAGDAGDPGLVPGSGRFPGRGRGNAPQYPEPHAVAEADKTGNTRLSTARGKVSLVTAD